MLSALLLGSSAVCANVLKTQDAALAEAFPGARTERRTVFLTEAQQKAVAEISGERVHRELVYVYDAFRGDAYVGSAYFDAHRVRTLPETVMVVVTPSNSLSRVEVVVFREPMEYLPDARWYDQFRGLGLEDGLDLKQGIDGITGATLTARAAVQAARRALAIHTVVSR